MICENKYLGTDIGYLCLKPILAILNSNAMKTKLLLSTFVCLFFANSFAQDKTIVSASNSEISDNLDLRAVASIFGDSKDLNDFEYRLNDPKAHLSNLDLNEDNQVDYLRVIESIEGNIHLIIIQAVLGQDQYQDVATVELERDTNNTTHIQVVGDDFIYGNNFIYEPMYNFSPIIYNYIWISNYRPYYSPWYWGYYPRHYQVWKPYPIIQYRNHIGLHINFNFRYKYVNSRRCQTAYGNYYGRRGNFYEKAYPNRSFGTRNQGYTNRYELNRTRAVGDVTYGSNPKSSIYSGTRNYTPKPNNAPSDPIQIDNIPIYRNSSPSSNTPRGNHTDNSIRSHSGGRR